MAKFCKMYKDVAFLSGALGTIALFPRTALKQTVE